MSFADVRGYFIQRGKELGYKEHPDWFNWQNIPSTNFDKAIHVSSFQFDGELRGQTDQPLTARPTVRLFFKSYQATPDKIDKATNDAENFINAALDSSKRLNQSFLKNVGLIGLTMIPFDVSNDNWIVAEIAFEVLIYKRIC